MNYSNRLVTIAIEVIVIDCCKNNLYHKLSLKFYGEFFFRFRVQSFPTEHAY